jgi:hypothetical protein
MKTTLPPIGSRVRMTSENSNWIVGEKGTITGHFDGGTGTNDRVSVEFDGRQDDYTAFPDDFTAL